MPEFDSLWNYEDPTGSELVFRKLLEEEASSWSAPDRAELLSQLARTLGLQRKFSEADRVLEEAETLAEGNSRAEARIALERGRVSNSSGDRASSIPFFEIALQRANEAMEDFYAVDAMHMLAIASPPERQMHWHKEAIAHAEKSTDAKARTWLGSLYNNLGWTLHDAGLFQEALAVFEKALAFRIEHGKPETIRIGKWCVARCLRSLGQFEQALERQLALEEENAHVGATDGFVCEEIAECLLALGRDDEAKPKFAKAFEVLSNDSWLASSEPERLARLKQMAGR